MAPLRSLFAHFRAHHDMDRPLLQWIGMFGCIAFPLFYVARRAVSTAPDYDDLILRLVASLLCLGLALRKWWPRPLAPSFIGYAWITVFYCLSFLLSYTMLRNQGGTPAVVNMLVAAVLVTLLADWRNAIVMLTGGYVLAAAVHQLVAPDPQFPREFIFAAGGSLLLVAGSALSHQGQKRVEINRMRRMYAGLAGSVAHEMRNPLAQVRHALDSIAQTLAPGGQRAASLHPGQVQAALVTIEQGRAAVARGLQAIDITLQQLRPDTADQARLRTVSALACVRAAVTSFAYEDAGQREHVAVRDEGDFLVRADPAALELVLFNLLKNALYYLPIHPDMVVTLTVMSGPTPRLIVHDTGAGIAPQRMPRLFEQFETAGKNEGTGLGLAFCRRVMRGLGGDITCRSEQGAYTEFTLAFPPSPAPSPDGADAPAPATRPLAGRTVMIVDDQALNRAIGRALARDMGLSVVEADHGQQALDLLRGGTRPDAILMDINMPGLDGFATTRLLRGMSGPVARLPVVAVTANDSPAIRAAALEAGMQGVLGKPIDRQALEQALESMLAGTQPAAPEPPAHPSDLLNARRLEDLLRFGLLHEQLPGALSRMGRQLDDLAAASAVADKEAATQALHAVVGLSAEAGAQALYATARARYGELIEGKFPAPAAIAEMRDVLAATRGALEAGWDLAPAPA